MLASRGSRGMFIRPYAEGDEAGLSEAASSSWPEIEPWMPWCHRGYSFDDAASWVRRQIEAFAAKTEFDFVIADASGVIVGACGLNQLDMANRRANLGYWIRTASAGHGYATAAVRLVVEWAFAHTDLQRLEVVIAVQNLASARVAQKAGAIAEGTLRSRLLLHGRFHDAVMHAFIRSDHRPARRSSP